MKKILSILLAICIMVGMVSVLASAEDPKKAYYYLPIASTAAAGATQTGYGMIEGDADRFYKVNDAGLVVAEGTESDYNIKVTFKQGEPLTLYLKGANINVPRGMGKSNNAAFQFGYNTNSPSTTIKSFDVLIVVETDSTLKNSWGTYDGTPNGTTHGRGTINADLTAEQTLTITGPGKLTVWSDCATPIVGPNIIFKDLTLDAKLEISHEWGGFVTVGASGDLTFDNTKANLENNYSGVAKAVNIVLKNGSDVTSFAHKDIESLVNFKATESYTIDNSKLLLNSNGAHAINKSPVTMTGVNALGGTKEANAKAFSDKRQADYWYLIAGPDVVIPTEPPTTAPPATTKPAATKATKATTATTAATKAPAGSAAASKPAGNDGANDATTGNDAETTPVDNNTTGEKKGGLTWLYILLGVVILAGAAVVVLVIVKRNAAAAEEEEYEEDEEAEDAEEAEEAEEVTDEPEATEDAE